jgi:hypothetical protein
MWHTQALPCRVMGPIARGDAKALPHWFIPKMVVKLDILQNVPQELLKLNYFSKMVVTQFHILDSRLIFNYV